MLLALAQIGNAPLVEIENLHESRPILMQDVQQNQGATQTTWQAIKQQQEFAWLS